MKKLKRTLIIASLTVMTVLTTNHKDFAEDLIQNIEYTEEFKEWIELPEQERQNTIMPRPYEIESSNTSSKNPVYMSRMLKAGIDSRYSLKDDIPANLAIRNQQKTNSCWTFAGLSALETNLALANYKNKTNLSKVYDFSERHMEYATSKMFANNSENKNGYNRAVGSGGNYYIALSYLTNGTGAVPEAEMPFENNEEVIDISEIKGKTVSSQVYDTVLFEEYALQDDTKRLETINKIKQHIQNYGSVQASLHGNSSGGFGETCYNNETGAKYCDSTFFHKTDHAVSIIGWNDNYSVENFNESSRPKNNGAWIVRNSWGERIEEKLNELKKQIFEANKSACISRGWNSAEAIPNSFLEQNGFTIEGDIAYMPYGDNGIIYVSYEDKNISKSLFGIVKATDTVNYDNLYQYDTFAPVGGIYLSGTSLKKIMICSVFDRETKDVEYLTQVSLYALQTQTCKVYVNPNGTSKDKSDLKLVSLKAGESETIDPGYHTLEFDEPMELNGNSFVVAIEIENNNFRKEVPLESKIEEAKEWDSVVLETGKCFIELGDGKWIDTSKLTEENENLVNGDLTIKAFTTSTSKTNTLKNIEIATPPKKTSYFEGEDFDKTGMVVKANYQGETNSSIVLDSSSYSITNGTNLKAGQTSVTISYQDKSVNQAITVEKNNVTELKIKTPPKKTSYYEGENFDKTDMVVEAKYKDGTTKIITDYKIDNGNNLKANQTQVTISYGGKSVNQAIEVKANPLVEIKVAKAPNKIKYVVGQDFDKEGMVIEGTYTNGTTHEILDYTIENGTKLAKDQSFVTIKYEGKTTTQPITVEEKNITGISISKKPQKTQYIQNKEELNLAGGMLKITYNDNSSEEIELTSEQIKVSGFDNTKVGKNTITITYQEKETTLDLEIVQEDIAISSNFDKVNSEINSIKYYTFSNKDTKEYLVMDITTKGIVKNSKNDSYEYYYYLSVNKNETDIKDWVKVKEEQTTEDELRFIVNTREVKNYESLNVSDTLYLYVKEVAKKGGDQSVVTSKAIKLEANVEIETYLDGVKVKPNSGNNNNNTPNTPNDSNTNVDNTTSPNQLPNTGLKSVLFLILLISIVGVVVYVKNKVLSKYTK